MTYSSIMIYISKNRHSKVTKLSDVIYFPGYTYQSEYKFDNVFQALERKFFANLIQNNKS